MSSDKSNQNEANKWPEPKGPWEKMVDCETCKGRHFGVGGAAGMLLVRRDDTKTDRPATHVILQHRSFSTTAGGTWAMPGGALGNKCETPRQAAIREASEEVGLPRACADGPDPTIVIWYENAFLDHGSWKYTTVIADVIKPFEPTVPQGDSESLETKWVAIQDVETLPLHPSFEQAWPELKSILETVPGTSTTW